MSANTTVPRGRRGTTRRRRRSAWNKRRKGQLEIDLRPRTKRGELAKKRGRPKTGRRMDPTP